MALDLGISQGKDAHALSRDVKKYLQHPDMLFRRVRDKSGVLHLSKRAKDYHPGRGVYRSSAKNALRLAATETNIAYRSADHANAVASPWVVGVRVVLSNNHTCKDSKGKPRPFTDICDTLAGDYPKGFKFTGWHPNCRCHVEYILKTPAEVQADTRRMLRGEQPIEANASRNYVGKLPRAFTDWSEQNKERVFNAKSKPYFIQDNKGRMDGEYLDDAVNEVMHKASKSVNEVQKIAETVARKHGATVTPINLKSQKSIVRKVYKEREDTATFSPEDLKDTVRNTIVADKSEMMAVIEDLKTGAFFVRHKPQDTEMGYTGNIVNIRTEQGIVAEIQVNTARMIYAKEKPEDAKSIIGVKMWNKVHRETGLEGGLGHRYYEEWRTLDPKSKKAIEIMKKSIAYYRNFQRLL